MNSRFFGLLALFLLAFTFCSQGQGTMAVSDFQCFGTDTFAAGLNDAGQVVGWVGLEFDTAQGFLKKKNGPCEHLAIDGATGTIPLGINDPGQIVGIAFSNDHPYGQAFLYEKGVYTVFDYPGAGGAVGQVCQTWAFSINNRGQIVGLYDRWKEATNPTDLPICDGPDEPFMREADGKTFVTLSRDSNWKDSAQANGINSRGMTIGNYLVDEREYGYLRNSDGSLVFPIQPPGAWDTMPTGINPQGQIVGRYFTEPWLAPIGPCHGFFLDSINVAPVELTYPDATYTCIGAINAPGEVSGAWANDVNGPWRSFVVDIKTLLPTEP